MKEENKEKERKEAYYTIGIISEMFNIHPQTLRMYERENLIKPKRSKGKTRLYSEEDVKRLRKILTLRKELGVNIAGIDIILRLQERIEAMEREFQEFIDYLQENLAKEVKNWKEHLNNALIKAPTLSVLKIEKKEKLEKEKNNEKR